MNQWRSAIDQALLLKQQPALANTFRSAALPQGMSNVIRLASDEGGRREELAQLLDIDVNILQKAATDYLLQICLYPKSDYLRCLCINNVFDFKLAKEHHKLLLKWLHPDRNAQNIAYAERVNQAWAWFKNQNNVVDQVLFSNTVDTHMHSPLPLPKSRLPLFLVVTFVFAGVLLAVSFWPDEQVYIDRVNYAEENNSRHDIDNAHQDLNQALLMRLQKPVPEVNAAPPVVSKSTKIKTEITLPSVKKSLAKQEIVASKIVKADQAKQMQTIKQLPNVIALKSAPTKKEVELIQSIQPQVLIAKPVVLDAVKPNNSALRIDQGLWLLDEFTRTFQAGNLQQFMLLFSAKALNNRGDRTAIEQDYRYLFTQSTRREIQFLNLQWRDKESLSLSARYDTKVKWNNKIWISRNSGSIEFYFVQENGKVRIQKILIGE
jgi:hypothetical protein